MCLSRRDQMMVARHGMPGMCHPEARPVRYGMIGWREGLSSRMVGKRGATDHTVPYGTDHVWPLPGISCLATFVSSLRDKRLVSLC
jgi:hypothetical protein